MEFNIAVVDDELSDIERLKSFIRNWFDRSEHTLGVIKSYTSGEDILREFVQGKFHVIFMDIIMNEINGIETARQIRKRDIRVPIAFITTSDEYIHNAFAVHPFDYVLKPYHEKEVFRVLNEAARVFSAYDPKVTLGEYEIPMRMISSVVSSAHNVEVNMTDGRTILCSMRFMDAEKLFVNDSRFIVCNRGIIVNMSEISLQDNGVFIMKDGRRYPIRLHDKSKIKSVFFQFLIDNMRIHSCF